MASDRSFTIGSASWRSSPRCVMISLAIRSGARGSPLVAPPLAETRIVRDNALQRANFSFEFRMRQTSLAQMRWHAARCPLPRENIYHPGPREATPTASFCRMLPLRPRVGVRLAITPRTSCVRLVILSVSPQRRQLRLPLPQLLFTNIRDTEPQFPRFTWTRLRLEAMSLGTKGFSFRLASLRACRRAGSRVIAHA